MTDRALERIKGRREPEASILGDFSFLTDSVMTRKYEVALYNTCPLAVEA